MNLVGAAAGATATAAAAITRRAGALLRLSCLLCLKLGQTLFVLVLIHLCPRCFAHLVCGQVGVVREGRHQARHDEWVNLGRHGAPAPLAVVVWR